MKPEDRMTSDHDGFRDLCAAHALGTLDPADSDRLRGHLEAGCRSCEREIEDYLETVGTLGRGLDPVPPPPGAEAEFLDRIGGAPVGDARRPRPRRSPLRDLMPAAALLIAAISLWLAWDARRQSARLVQENLVLHEAITSIPSSSARVLPLQGDSPDAHGWIVIEHGAPDVSRDDWILVHAFLPAPPAGSAYHAWVRIGTQTRWIGLVDRDSDGYAFVRRSFELTGPLAGATISLERQLVPESPIGPVILEYRPEDPAP